MSIVTKDAPVDRTGEIAAAIEVILPTDRGAAHFPGFDAEFYLRTYPDIVDLKVSPLAHFLGQGWKEGRDPSPGFSTKGYLVRNPDVAAAGVNPLLHFLSNGLAEGRVGWQTHNQATFENADTFFRDDVFRYYRRKVAGF